LPLGEPLAPGAAAEITAEFSSYAVGGLEGGARYGISNGVLLAPTFYPMIPRFVDGAWETAPAPTGGDTTNSETSFYAWRVTAPAGMAVAATGTMIDSSSTDTSQTQVLVTGPVRDLALVVGPLEATQRTVEGITVTAYVLPQHAAEADDILEQAAAQIENLQAAVGPYPFTELDIVDAPGAFGGIEYPALIFIGVVGEGYFEVANVHEVGHQWFYSLIGDDQLREPWLDEAAASYTEVLYYEAAYGAGVAQEHLDNFWNYVDASQNPDLPIGLPIDEYPGGDYGLLVYGKGALFFDALRRELGDETFFAFLRNYYEAYHYGFATSAGFQAVAEETCACELDELFNLWVFEGGPVERP
jgi:aminopeptidase N